MKRPILASIAAIFAIGALTSHADGQTAGSMSLTATLKDQGNGGEHWMVAWVTDATTGAYVRTLRKQCNEPRGNHLQSHLGSWYTAAGLTASAANFAPADGYTTATAITYAAPNSPFTTTWNCKDALGNTVPDGTYKMWIQYAEDGLGSPVTTATGTTMTWTKGPSASTTNFPDQGTNFTGMKVVWTPTVVTPAPEIAVEQPVGTDISDAGSKDFGSVTVGSSAPLTFTIKNIGNADLTGLTITKDGTNAADFTITSSPTAPVAGPSGTTTFIVSFAPGAAGARTAAIHIANNDSNENPFDINLTGTGTVPPAPEIAVEQPVGTDIPDAGSKDFGSVNIGSSAPLTFTIKNTGNANLTGLTIIKDGTNAADFTITSSPTAPVAGPSGTTTFIVSFAPGAAGARTAAIHIANNDSNENPFDINLTGTGTVPPAPEIAVEQPVGTDIPDAGSKDFGSVNIGSSAPLTFTIKNTGNANLTGLTITKDGTNAADFTITSSPAAPVAGPSGTTTFIVSFAPGAAGTRTAAIHIANNDSNENPFDINLTGTGSAIPAPEIAVEQPVGTDIADAGSKDFGSVNVGSNTPLTFTIKNTGSADLTGLTITKDGTHAADFTVTSSPAAPVAGPSGTTTFIVSFAPGAAGARTAAIHIANNDSNENPFDINLTGTGTVPAPEIAVEQPVGTDIPDAGSKNFGSVTVGSSTPLTFTIKNTGNADLTGLTITKDGTNAADFTVTSSPVAPVAGPSGTTTLIVSFAPSAVGSRSAAIHIANNDSNENPFDINLTGTGAAPPAPEIAVEQPVGTDIPDAGSKDFGSVSVGSNASLTFTIKNTGNADLTGLTITQDGTNPNDFTVTSSPVAPVAGPSGTTTLMVRFAPSAEGSRSAAIHIANNDSDENPFDINVTGTGTPPAAPEIAVEQPVGTDIADAGSKDFGSVSVGSNASLTFTIKNTGNANLTDLTITKDGANAGDFTVTSSPTAPVTGPSGTSSFVVRFAPSAEGARSAAIHIANNDSNENPFDINLTGTGTASITDPFAICIVGALFEPRVGNQITLDLNRLTSPGQTIRIRGRLPSGLTFNNVTGLISGTISGRPGSYQVRVQILQGRTVVRTITLPITVLPFPSSLIGDYDSLLENTEGVPTGALRISITSANRWSATLETEGASKRTTTGNFTLAQGLPVAPITTVFPAAAGAQSVTISLSIDGASPNITATYNGGTLRGFRLANAAESSSMTVPYNLVFDAGVQDGINVPAGLGWMKGKVSRPETGTFSGLLGDGTPASLTLRLSPAGQAVLWTQPYTNKKSFVGGIVTLGNLGQPVSTNPKLTDTLWWSKAADDRTLSYPDGFPAMPITLGTSRWTTAYNASALGASLGWRENRKTSVTIDGAGLSNQSPQSTTPELPTEFTLDDSFNLIGPKTHNNNDNHHSSSNDNNSSNSIWKGKVMKYDGTFTGVLTIPEEFSNNIPSGSADVSGVLVQDDAWGIVTGCGLIKVPTSDARGSFRTAAIILEQ